jgi:hypothetical protein
MTSSLQDHSPREVTKQLSLRMKRTGLATVKVVVTRRAGKIQINFTGSSAEVAQAQVILANWA